jgi:hypothetical protein
VQSPAISASSGSPPDDRWSADPAQAEPIEDEAHADIRLLDAEIRAPLYAAVGLVDALEIERLAS